MGSWDPKVKLISNLYLGFFVVPKIDGDFEKKTLRQLCRFPPQAISGVGNGVK